MKSVIEKIQKLLALSESCNQHEAELAAQKAQELLSKHNLSIDACFLNSNSTDAIDKERFEFRGAMKKWREELMHHVVQSVDCDALYSYNKCNTICAVTIYGLDQSVKIALYIYKYLEYTVDRLRKQYVKKCNSTHKELTGKPINLNQRYHFEKSYTLGIVQAVSYKLRQQKADTPPTPGALVPVIGALIEQKKQDDCPDYGVKRERKQEIIESMHRMGFKDGSNIAVHKGITSDGGNQTLSITHI